MAPLGALSQAWVSAEASLPQGWEIAGAVSVREDTGGFTARLGGGTYMSQLAQQHQWQLGSHAADRFADHSAGSSGIAISAVCASCGLVRVQVVASIGEQHIDLRGACPGTPQEPGGHVHGEWPQVGALRDDAS